jgi:hypothetical protein
MLLIPKIVHAQYYYVSNEKIKMNKITDKSMMMI